MTSSFSGSASNPEYLGVSVVICCHNSAGRLPTTLAHLALQSSAASVAWEVIVIDNASTDDTGIVARQSWPQDSKIPLRVVRENQLGLSHARVRGFAEARHEIVSFIDDDNWVCEDWIRLVAELMTNQPELGACGGFSEAVCEIEPPSWFTRHKMMYAIGPDLLSAGDVTERRLLWGAGLTIRRTAWEQLLTAGFAPLAVDRKGKELSSGGDSEICLALRLAGWRLYYEPRMRLRHYLPAGRLNWDYLKKLYRAAAAATVYHDPYYFALKPPRSGWLNTIRRLRQLWTWRMISNIFALVTNFTAKLSVGEASPSSEEKVLVLEMQLGKVQGLFKARKHYADNVKRICRLARRLQSGNVNNEDASPSASFLPAAKNQWARKV